MAKISWFPGWNIVAMTMMVQFFSVGVGYYTFGVFLKPLTAELDANRTLIALTTSFQMVLMSLLGPWIGRKLADGSVKAYMLTGVVLITIGLLISSQATTLWHLYVGFGLVLSPGLVLTGVLPNNVLLTNWFNRRRGMAMGISQFGISISGTVLVPLTSWIIINHGWRAAFLAFAVVTPIVLLPLIHKFAINTPEEIGLQPDGDNLPDAVTATTSSAIEWTFMRAVRMRDVWLLAFIVGPSFMGVASVVLAMHSHVTDLNFSAAEASIVVAVTTFFGAVAKPTFGTLADFIHKRLVVAVSIFLQVVGVSILLVADSWILLLAAGASFGLGYGATAPMWSLLIAECFGRDSFARVMGAVMPLTMPFNLIALPLTTLAFDLYGSYFPAFAGLLVFYTVSAICLSILRLPSEKPIAQ